MRLRHFHFPPFLSSLLLCVIFGQEGRKKFGSDRSSRKKGGEKVDCRRRLSSEEEAKEEKWGRMNMKTARDFLKERSTKEKLFRAR